jgi:bifunctional non-homologous end joining protein LigD
VLECAEVALELRGMLGGVGLESFPKTSGSKGIQVYVPLNRKVTYDDTKPFARAVARLLEKERPGQVVSSMKKEVRRGKVFVDWSQNDDHKTTACVYSLRARERPTASTPLRWEEVEDAFGAGDADRLVFEAGDVIERVSEHGDLFAPVLELRQQLPKLTAV